MPFDRRSRLAHDHHLRSPRPERATLAGGADWSSAQARAVVDSLLAEK